MSTPDMGLDLPVPGVTPAITWANLLNEALTKIDSHDHTPGNGAPLPTGKIQVFSSISQMQATASPVETARLYLCEGYAASGDGGGGLFYWVDGMTGPDSCFTFAVAGHATGWMQRYLPGYTEVTLPMCGLFSSNSTPQGAALLAAYNKVVAANNTFGYGIKTLRIPSNFTLVITDGCFIPGGSISLVGSGRTSRLVGATSGDPSPLSLNTTFVGTSLTDNYSPLNWTQTLTTGAGTTVMTGFASVVGLSVGQLVMVRYGADPTDQGLSCFYAWDVIKAISGSTVTFERGCPGALPSGVGINIARLTNKHDILIPDKIVDGIKVGNFATRNVLISLSGPRSSGFDDIFIEEGTQALSIVWDTDCHIRNCHADFISNRAAGIQAWMIQGWSHNNLVFENISAVHDGGSFYSQEGKNRGTVGRNVKVLVRNDNAQLCNFILTTDALTIYDALLDGTGDVNAPPPAQFVNLEVRGAGVNAQIYANQVTGYFVFRGITWNAVKCERQVYVPNPSSSDHFMFPTWGVPRSISFRVSTATGLTLWYQNAQGTTSNLNLISSVIAGTMVSVPASSSIGKLYPGGFSDGSATPNYTYIDVAFNGSWPAGAHIEVESTWWVTDDPAWIAAQPKRTLFGIGAPSVNSDFCGQEYLDYSTPKLYRSVRRGSGSGDWIVL